MADLIKCPSCGESNQPDQEFCHYCRTRLQPLTSSTKGTDAPIKPGQLPTKKNTAELEPILPQWLRDARDTARKSAEDDAAMAAKKAQAAPASSTPDLLAGLHSQADNDEDETPDWLASITGDTPKSRKAQAESPEVRWVELGDAKDFPKEEPPAKSETPAWLADINAANSKSDEKDELGDWFRAASSTDEPLQPARVSPFEIPSSNDGTADWLKQMAADSMQDDGSGFNNKNEDFKAPPSSADTPDWLRQMNEQEDIKKETPLRNESKPAFDIPSSDTPDWLRSMGGVSEESAQSADPFNFPGSGSVQSEAPGIPAVPDENMPDWLKAPPPVESASKPRKTGQLPAWLKDESNTAPEEEEVPVWLAETPAPVQPAAGKPEPFLMDDQAADLGDDVPSWLQAAAPQSSVFDIPPSEQPATPVSESADAPDWLNAFKSVDAPQQTPAFSLDEPFESSAPAFTSNPLEEKNGEALFTEMPDWLSNVTESSSSRSSVTNPESIAPGELPSWVQAMRPVDSTPSRPVVSSSSQSSDQTLESRGALAGLQGVLPSVPGYAPTSKPKAYSIKLQASDEQQSHAALLEQILAAETEPVPIASFSALRTSRTLRWILAAVLLAVLTVASFAQTRIFSLPTDVPYEIGSAWQVVQSIPEGAPVLVAFDYEPARVGEMEAIAAPLFNLMKNPALTFLSTNETGALLADRFASGPMASLNNGSGLSYSNLGYLPGGQMGIRAFAEFPSAAMPQLAGITSFSQFSAFILITDNADDARTWIEQTASARGPIPFVVVSSAQAAPMIQPYFESQQINGLVGGLYGSAVLEANNPGGPGIARAYWDSFSIGMLLAMVLILGGGLLNLGLGLRDRAAARGA